MLVSSSLRISLLLALSYTMCSPSKHQNTIARFSPETEGWKEYIIYDRVSIQLDTNQCSWHIYDINDVPNGFYINLTPCSLYNDVWGLSIAFSDPRDPEGLLVKSFNEYMDTLESKNNYLSMPTCRGNLSRYIVRSGRLRFEVVTDSSCVADSLTWPEVQSKAWAWAGDGYELSIWYSDSIQNLAVHNENFRRILSAVRVLD